MDDRSSIPGKDRIFLFDVMFRPALKQNQCFIQGAEYSWKECGRKVKLAITS
jgi:hypothetical protein